MLLVAAATTEVIYNAPTTRLRRSIVFDTDKPSAECWAPMPRPSLLSQMIYKAVSAQHRSCFEPTVKTLGPVSNLYAINKAGPLPVKDYQPSI